MQDGSRNARASFRVFIQGLSYEPEVRIREEAFLFGFFRQGALGAGQEFKKTTKRRSAMDNATKEKLAACAVEAKKKAIGLWNICKAKTVATWQSGRKGKAICIGVAAVVAVLLMQCGGGGGGGEGGGGGTEDSGRGGQYTGEIFSHALGGAKDDEGVIYKHEGGWFSSIKVFQSTSDGNLVSRDDFNRIVLVVTPGRRYEDGERLDTGYYIRRGLYEYVGADGAAHTVARYVEVTDKRTLEEIAEVDQALEAKRKAQEAEWEAKQKAEKMAQEEQRKAEEEQRKAAKEAEKQAELEAAERGAYELDIPVKSLCGFKLGAPPSQVAPLLQNDDGTPVEVYDLVKGRHKFRLTKPFRLFTHVEVSFAEGAGKHLDAVELMAELDEDVERESYAAEAKTLSESIGKKFGLKFEFWDDVYSWEGTNQSIRIDYSGYALVLEFEARNEISDMDEAAKRKPKKSFQFDADAGADEL